MAKQETQQPPYAPQPNPSAQYGPEPKPQNTPYEEQPVNQQYFAQPQAAPVQYVIMAKSLKGVRGGLAFFMIAFSIYGINLVSAFFSSLLTISISNPEGIVSVIFAPLTATLSITSAVLIGMQKKLARSFSVATLMASFLYISCSVVVSAIVEGPMSYGFIIVLISIITTSMIITMLLSVYFFSSRAVKETLVN